MKVDVSEIKTFKTCKRQWELSSRNKFHLRPKVLSPNLTLGTLFHEALAQLYLGVSLETVMKKVRSEMNPDTDAALLAMIPGYVENVLPDDLKRFKVLDVEHHFEIEPKTSAGKLVFERDYKLDTKGDVQWEPGLLICGSIDMIVLDVEENKIYGFEHKTCKSFRDEAYLWMDEQPRVYTWALQQYVDEYNRKVHRAWELKVTGMRLAYDEAGGACGSDLPTPEYPPEPIPATLGGVYLNEVKKLLRQFQYQRTLCTYTQADLDNFMQSFFSDCRFCSITAKHKIQVAPQPNYMNCKLCQFQTICKTYMYAPLNETEVLDKFSEDFVKRSQDHLDEKPERSTEDAP